MAWDDLDSELADLFGELQSLDRREFGARGSFSVVNRWKQRPGTSSRDDVRTFECVVCSDLFPSVHPNAKYCSPACARSRLDGRSEPRSVACECGSVFATHQPVAAYCSERCRLRAYRRRKRQEGRVAGKRRSPRRLVLA